MSPSNEGPRRDPDHPEDNPFIAFRHFTDKHVSSLLGVMFSLPATLFNPSPRQTAIGKCIVGGAGLASVDPGRCKELFEMEKRISETLAEAQQMSHMLGCGQAQALEDKHKEIVRNISRAEIISRQILEETGLSSPSASDDNQKHQSELVEKVANAKGQEWAWSWAWGFPAPFDASENQDEECSWAKRREARREERRARWRRRQPERSDEEHDESTSHHMMEDVFSRRNQRRHNAASDHRSDENEPNRQSASDAKQLEDSKRLQEIIMQDSRWSSNKTNGQEPDRPQEDSKARDNGNSQHQELSQPSPKEWVDIMHEADEHVVTEKTKNDQGKEYRAVFWPRAGRTVYTPPDGRSYVGKPGFLSPPSYFTQFDHRSPQFLEEHEVMRKAGFTSWRDAFEDLYALDAGAPLMPKERLGQSKNMPYGEWVKRFQVQSASLPLPAPIQKNKSMPKDRPFPRRVPWEGEETSEEPSYEYAHDHEDQHDDPPTPTAKTKQGRFAGGLLSGMPATELDAYERLLSSSSAPAESTRNEPPSPLSTLTTTERTIAPDGTVTTKVVLRKRFADGHEESSESVRTQLAKDTEQQQYHQSTNTEQGGSNNAERKSGGGWFWSK